MWIEEGLLSVRLPMTFQMKLWLWKRLKMEKEKEGFPITSLRDQHHPPRRNTNVVTVRVEAHAPLPMGPPGQHP